MWIPKVMATEKGKETSISRTKASQDRITSLCWCLARHNWAAAADSRQGGMGYLHWGLVTAAGRLGFTCLVSPMIEQRRLCRQDQA